MRHPGYDAPTAVQGPLYRETPPRRRPLSWAQRKEAAKTFLYAALTAVALATLGLVAELAWAMHRLG